MSGKQKLDQVDSGGGANGQPHHHQPVEDGAGFPGTDLQFVTLRTTMREKIFECIEKKQLSTKMRMQLPQLAERLEEISYRKFPDKNDYYNMMKGPIEPQLQFAIETLSAQQNQQNPQVERQTPPSSSSNLALLKHLQERLIVTEDDPLPGIEGLRITGEPFPGRELQASGYPTNGTTTCNFEWVRHLEDGSVNFIGAMQPSYVVTADDVDTLLAIEVQPLDDRKRKGDFIKVYANDQRKISCDPETKELIKRTLEIGHVTYEVQVQLPVRFLDIWEPAMLAIKREGYSIKCNGQRGVVITEKFQEGTAIHIPYGRPTEFLITSADGVSYNLKPVENTLLRDTIVLVLRLFKNMVVQTSQGLYTETVHEDSRYMELNILEHIVNESEEPSPLDFALLHSITENFSEKRKIGSGGCGIVYKGILRNGVVAVKRLHSSRTIKDKMFHREVISLISVKHPNIVRFLGYCSFTKEHAIPLGRTIIMADIRERLLCFEYIRNGSLDQHLSDELRGLEWQKRYQIIIGICRGLHYLHKDKKIIHMDLKPGNILLDDLMVPKITDFGLSRFISDLQATTTLLISQGYVAPEYISQGKATSYSDIYSLGVIIIELVTGSRTKPNITKVIRRWNHRWIKSMKQSSLAYQQVKKCLELALRCIQDDPTDRPDISDIIKELKEKDTTDGQAQIQISSCCLEDILGIEPLEIRVPFEDLKISHSIELTNDTDDYIAFVTKAKLERFCTEPEKGIVPPRSKCSVLAMQAQVNNAVPNKQYTEVITVLSTRVDGSLSVDAMDVTSGEIFADKEGKVVDEVNVMVVFGTPQLAEE